MKHVTIIPDLKLFLTHVSRLALTMDSIELCLFYNASEVHRSAIVTKNTDFKIFRKYHCNENDHLLEVISDGSSTEQASMYILNAALQL